jgi:hypothetical protein
MKIGIYLKGEDLPDRFYKITQDLIKNNDETIKRMQLAKDPTICRIETDKNTYQLVRINAYARGYRFHKVYYDKNTEADELYEIILPHTIINTDGDRIEMIKED